MNDNDLLDSSDATLWEIVTKGDGPAGKLPLTEDLLLNAPSGDLFGLTQNAGMGWRPDQLLRKQYLILSTQGGIRGEDGKPIALGYHTGHYEVGLLMRAAAEELDRLEALPFAGYVSDPCDGRTQGTVGMMDSLPYRNDAAIVLKRLIRSLPTRRGVIGVATCDKGLPAMMMALASQHDLPCVIVPGGVTLPPAQGEDAGKVQTIGARFAHGDITLEEAAEAGCRACGSPGGGCQFLGTAATSQVIAEALGLSLPHSALAPSGQPIWLDAARRSARAVVAMEAAGKSTKDVLTADALHNAMVIHAACGGSTNLLLHIPAFMYEAKLPRPTVEDWNRINRQVPRLVDCLPNGPVGHPTVRFFLAGGVPELMLHLRTLGLLKLDAFTVSGRRLGDVLEWWEQSDRRLRLKEVLRSRDGVDANSVIMSPPVAKSRGLTSTVTFPTGNIAPNGSVVKSTSIDKSVVDADGVYRKTGPARVFTSEREAIAAVKGRSDRPIIAGDILVLMCRGPLGCGMEETYQITSALRYLSYGKQVALITDARFSGVSTGACIGHVGPEALEGGPIGKLRDGDTIHIEIDTVNLTGRLDFIGENGRAFSADEGARILEKRIPGTPLHCDPRIPDDTRLWAALQRVGGGTWAGCVYDVDAIVKTWMRDWPLDIWLNWGLVMRWFELSLILFVAAPLGAAERTAANPQASAAVGWDVLTTHQFLPADFDEDVFNELWTVWPEPDRSEAEILTGPARRQRMFSYYGLMPAAEEPGAALPALGYIDNGHGGWVMNCLACHGGKVAGQVVPGLPNSHFAMQTLVEDVTLIKLKQGKKLTHLDLGATQIPLSMSNGATNAVIFGVLLGVLRNPDMSVDLKRKPPEMMHHDMDAPPFWNVRKKTSLYADGFAPKTPRPLMQFILIPRNGPEQLAHWEDDFRQIQAWIESTEPPKYPWDIDESLARTGKIVFREHCSRCHGTYGPQGVYEQKTIAIQEIGTDPVRWEALTPEHRRWMKVGWLSRYGEDDVEEEPIGYVAPPLDGIWASAPYFHNGSVPTLWHVLHPGERPQVWKRNEDGYDQGRGGLEVEEFDAVPKSVRFAAHRRRYFDTALRGKSAAGHLYPNKLTEDEKAAVLEYLKSL